MKNNMDKYNSNITYILSELDKIQVGEYIEVSANHRNHSARTIANNIKKEFTSLLTKIEEDLK